MTFKEQTREAVRVLMVSGVDWHGLARKGDRSGGDYSELQKVVDDYFPPGCGLGPFRLQPRSQWVGRERQTAAGTGERSIFLALCVRLPVVS